MPQVITFSDGSTITYTYAADGTKLRTVHVISATTIQTDYCGNVIYESGAQKYLLNEVGYYNLASSVYCYYLKDHQGNNRVVINSSGTVLETNHYYPFGGLFASTSVQPFKYNGKEFDSKKGLNWYDYGARHYDATLGRWHVVDPLADKYYGYSPYNYCGNNPVIRIDQDGRIWDTIWDALNVVYDVVAAAVNHITGDHEQAKEHWKDAAVDGFAMAVPGLPAGASKFIKTVDKVTDTAKATDRVADGAKVVDTSRSARREVMREEGIPTSQQPVSQSKNLSGREYTYETAKSYGEKETKSVQQQTLDRSHQGEPHWEAGNVKVRDGQIQYNQYGRVKLDSDKSKVYYEKY